MDIDRVRVRLLRLVPHGAQKRLTAYDVPRLIKQLLEETKLRQRQWQLFLASKRQPALRIQRQVFELQHGPFVGGAAPQERADLRRQQQELSAELAAAADDPEVSR